MVGLRCRVLDVRVIFLDRYRVHMQWELHRGTAGPLTNLAGLHDVDRLKSSSKKA